MKQLEVQIMQQSYLLGCPEGREGAPARSRGAGGHRHAARIRDAGKVRARERIAVLAALNMAFELADRESADLAAASAAPSPTALQTVPQNGDDRLRALVQRLDEVLGNDGRLI